MGERVLGVSGTPLWDRYDLALLDLDGVVYIGAEAVPGAPGHLARAKDAGMHLAYVTNNASRPPEEVATHLRELGIDAEPADVVTSAQAAASVLAERLPAGSAVFVIGGRGLVRALEDSGLRPVQSIEEEPSAVVSGFHRDLRWGIVVDGAILVRRGLPWVAANTDLTVPTSHGPGPGNGQLVETVARFAGRRPVVAGKPQPPLFEEALRRVAGRSPLVVGDRLDTDIEGAVNARLDSLLVLTGVTGLAELSAAPPGHRPRYLSLDLAGLGRAHSVPEEREDGFTMYGVTARVASGRVEVDITDPGGDPREQVEHWWRVVACTAWRHLDATGRPADVAALRPPPPDGVR